MWSLGKQLHTFETAVQLRKTAEEMRKIASQLEAWSLSIYTNNIVSLGKYRTHYVGQSQKEMNKFKQEIRQMLGHMGYLMKSPARSAKRRISRIISEENPFEEPAPRASKKFSSYPKITKSQIKHSQEATNTATSTPIPTKTTTSSNPSTTKPEGENSIEELEPAKSHKVNNTPTTPTSPTTIITTTTFNTTTTNTDTTKLTPSTKKSRSSITKSKDNESSLKEIHFDELVPVRSTAVITTTTSNVSTTLNAEESNTISTTEKMEITEASSKKKKKGLEEIIKDITRANTELSKVIVAPADDKQMQESMAKASEALSDILVNA